MSRKITLLDGAVGTSLWEKAEAHGRKKDPVWQFNITHPEIVTELNREYADAGAQIVLANTFGANGPAVKRYPGFALESVITSGVRLARRRLKNRKCAQKREIFAIDKEFFRRNTPVFQGKILQDSAKRSAVWAY